MVTYRWQPQDSTTTGYLYVPGISASTFPWLSDFLSELYRFFSFFFFFTFSSPCFCFLTRKITYVSVTSVHLSYSVFTGISCLEIHYLSRKVLDRGAAARNSFHSTSEDPYNFNPTCSLTFYGMSGDLRRLHANGVCLTRVLCVKRVGKCYVKEELGLQRDLCVFLNNNVFSYVKV